MDSEIVILIFGCVLLVYSIYMMATYNSRKQKKEEQEAKIAQERAQKAEEEKKERELKSQKFESEEKALFDKYGKDTKRLDTVWDANYDITKYIYVFPTSKVMIIKGKEYKFDDILRFELTDKTTTKTTTTGGNAKFETNIWDATGRADAAKMLFGSREASMAAAQSAAKIKVEPKVTSSTTKHDYTIVLYVKDFNEPVVEIKLGDHESFTRKIMGVLEVIKAN